LCHLYVVENREDDDLLLALYQGHVEISQDNFLKFTDSTLSWQENAPVIYYQEWYTHCMREIKAIYDGPKQDQTTFVKCERTYELYGSAGTGKTIAGLVMIHEIGRYADPPDILYIRREDTSWGTLKKPKSEDVVRVTLLCRDIWGRARSFTVLSTKKFEELDHMLSLRRASRKLCVLIDTFPPMHVLRWFKYSKHPMFMCIYVASYGSRALAKAGEDYWPFEPGISRLVSGVSKVDYLAFGYACAPGGTQTWIDDAVTSGGGSSSSSSSSNNSTSGNKADTVVRGSSNSSTSSSATGTTPALAVVTAEPPIEERRKELMSFAYDILGGSARYLLRLGSFGSNVRDKTMHASLVKWFREGGNNPTDKMRLAVLGTCADMACCYTQDHKSQTPSHVVAQQAEASLTEFSSLFLRQVRDADDTTKVRSVAATATMLYVLYEMAQNQEDEMWKHMVKAIGSSGMGFLFEQTSMIYLYKHLLGKRELMLTGIGNRMRGLSMTINLGTLGLQLNTVTEEKKVEDLRVNDFAVCVKENFAMIDGICLLPASVTVNPVVNSLGNRVSLVGDDSGDLMFFASGRMKMKDSIGKTRSAGSKVLEEDLPENRGVALGLQVASGSEHKLGRNPDVLYSYRKGMIDNQFPRLLVMLFCVTDTHFDEFDVSDEPAGSNVLCFKFACNRSLKRRNRGIAQGSPEENDEDREDIGEQKAKKNKKG
jgi:hypothetical protein